MKYLCKAPFTQMSIDPRGAVLPCCRIQEPMGYLKDERIDDIWNNDNYKALRQKFLDGEKPIECTDCWNAEDAGQKSMRHWQNDTRGTADLHFTSSHVNTPPILYEFKTTNVCNLKCRMCGAFNSSQIAKEQSTPEVRKHYLSNKLIGTAHEPIIKKWLVDSKYILLAGGEPFVNNEIKDLLQYLDDNDLLGSIHIQVITNGMYYNQKFVDQFKRCESFELKISLDDLGERNDYQREGSDFDLIEENFFKLAKDFKNVIEFNCTMNWFNIWHIDELLEYADNNATKVSICYCENPKFFALHNLPQKIKDQVNEKFKSLNDERINLILNRMNLPADPSVRSPLQGFFDHCKYYDKLRGNDFRTAFPEWSKILENELPRTIQ